jgi:6-pyruvoyltetrahydropterin/6-carboxytetrahydropterin synthase
MKITRKIEFAMGHRLQRHEGLCRHIHGHNYVVEVEVTAQTLDEQGMVIDFHHLREAMEAVFKKYDHGFVVEMGDPFTNLRLKLDNWESCGMNRIVEIGAPPTAECLAKHWLGELDARIGKEDGSMWVSAVTVFESSTTSARYENHAPLFSNR